MATYQGKPVVIKHPAEEIYNKLSDLSSFQEKLESLPAEAREKLGDVHFTADSIVISAPAVGEMVFKLVEKVPFTTLRFAAENSPVPFGITISLKTIDENTTEAGSKIEVEIPAMLRPLIGSKMQEAADKFSEMLSTLFVA